ncbi:MAG: hypothetical protein KGO52_13295 [Nitrospirota bacterium]|nr:hypothetical protein [Nitrospirota bacterium]MDE3224510.1 hypothetical protein [Nitrospirota bacterium]MDE3243687.1 hypothetical protein [Nitrospirota bacterium]
MATIQIKTPYPEQAAPLVKDAIEMEKKMVRGSLATTNERIAALTHEWSVTADQVLSGTVSRTEANEMALLELEGELAIRRSLEEALRSLDSLELCS